MLFASVSVGRSSESECWISAIVAAAHVVCYESTGLGMTLILPMTIIPASYILFSFVGIKSTSVKLVTIVFLCISYLINSTKFILY